MAGKKKTTKKAKKTVHKKATPTTARKRSKKLTKKRPAPNGAQQKRVAAKKQPRKKGKSVGELAFSPVPGGSRSGGQSGDLQGLSRLGAADSESVDEPIQEGNSFEADVVAGIERADNTDEQEVRTHQVQEDDVPGEYLDKEIRRAVPAVLSIQGRHNENLFLGVLGPSGTLRVQVICSWQQWQVSPAPAAAVPVPPIIRMDAWSNPCCTS
jgi:hypothetical protein